MFRRKSISEAASTDALECLLANVSPYIMYTYLLLFHFANICIGIIYFLSVRLTQGMLRFDRVSSSTTNTAGYFFRFFVYFVMYLQIYLKLRNRQEFKKLAFTCVCISSMYLCSYIVIIHLSKRQKFFF